MARVKLADYPHTLTTGSVVFHYLSGTQTRRVPFLMEQCPEPYAEMHPDLAARYALKDGDYVYLETRRGNMEVKAKITNS